MEYRKADLGDVEGIVRVCIEGNRDTYQELYSKEYLDRVIEKYYTVKRVAEEVIHTNRDWQGYYVAKDGNQVVGAIGGGMLSDNEAEIYVLYLDPNRRREGIGKKLLQLYTDLQRKAGATTQWVSVAKGNHKGIPFYEAMGFQFVSEQQSYESIEDHQYSYRYKRSL